MNILQLKQDQIPNLPFTFYRGLGIPGSPDPIVFDKEGRYLIVPTYIAVAENSEMDHIHNLFLWAAKTKGFTHLMLIYN